MKGLLALALIGALLAGCGGTTVSTCESGASCTTSDASTGGNVTVPPPTVTLAGGPLKVQAYGNLTLTWTVNPGNRTNGHTMLTEIRLSHHSMSLADLNSQGAEQYGIETLGLPQEHQNLPAKTGLTFTTKTNAGDFPASLVGVRYVRAYAQVYADGLPQKEYWSDEVTINITAVAPTGKVWNVVHGVTGPTTKLSPDAITAKLGDQLTFENDDVLPHDFVPNGAPQCSPPFQTTSLGSGVPAATKGPATPIMFTCPGSYAWKTTDTPTPWVVAITVGT